MKKTSVTVWPSRAKAPSEVSPGGLKGYLPGKSDYVVVGPWSTVAVKDTDARFSGISERYAKLLPTSNPMAAVWAIYFWASHVEYKWLT
jgi:hypothetical protein